MNGFKTVVTGFPRSRIIVTGLTLVLVFLAFFVKSLIFLDPDFGWHLRTGQLILSRGIPTQDPFSYTMPSFLFVDHEWLSDAVIAELYPLFGLVGLAAVFSLLAVIALVVSLAGAVFPANVIFLLLGGGILLPFVGIRPQVESWLLLAILIQTLFNPSLWSKLKFLVPFALLLWANLHGSFALGVLILFLVSFIKLIHRRLGADLIFVSLLSVGAASLNPYRIRIWGEVFSQISNSSLRQTVLEWMPSFFFLNLPLLFLIVLSGLLILVYRQRLGSELFTVFLFLSSLALTSVRHVPLLVVAALPLDIASLQLFVGDFVPIPHATSRLKRVGLLALIIGFGLFAYQFTETVRGFRQIGEENYYPKRAVAFLKTRPICGEIFSEQSWGGYLIWQLPEKKVFIDGRMPSWRWSADLTHESNWAMDEYQKVLSFEIEPLEIFRKYNVGTVLFPVSRPALTPAEIVASKLPKIFGRNENQNRFLGYLESHGFKAVFRDPVAVVYEQDDCYRVDR